jgi:hypothetical protein
VTIDPTDLDWLALTLVTESNRPNEWPAIAQVIENRRRTGRWGSTYKSVCLAPMQFSAFNGLTGKGVRPETLGAAAWTRMAKEESLLLVVHAAVMTYGHSDNLNQHSATVFTGMITPATLHYWSPVSMHPTGSKPAWAGSAKRVYCPPDMDPERFQFCEGVP